MSCQAPCSRCRRQLVSKDEYNPSRRNRAPSSPGFLQASACVRMRSRYSAGKRRRWAFAGTSGSGSVARDVTEGPKAAVALRAPSASAPSATSISTAAGMRVIHRTLPAPTLTSPGRLSHGLLAQGAALGGRRGARSGEGVPSGARMSRYARAGRCPPGTRRAVRTRGVVRDGCVVVNQATAEFQQLTGHPRAHIRRPLRRATAWASWLTQTARSDQAMLTAAVGLDTVCLQKLCLTRQEDA